MEALVSSIQSLNDVSHVAMNRLLELASFKKYQKKDILCLSNTSPDKVYFIKSGIMRAYIKNANGSQFNKSIFWDGHFAGCFDGLISKKATEMTLECLTNCEVLEANYDEVSKLLDTDLELSVFGRRIMEKMYLSYEKRETELATLNAKQRYLNFIEKCGGVEKNIPQYHIASHLGITSIQLSRIKKELRKS